MIQLPLNSYYKVLEALNKVDYNHYFAKAVVIQHVEGKIFVDNIHEPTVFYIYHPYGMGLLIGDYTNAEFINRFQYYCLNTDNLRSKSDWLQVFPLEWNVVIQGIARLTQQIETFERINFDFNREKYSEFRKSVDFKKWDIIETDENVFQNMPGTVVPRFFWNNASDFRTKAKGYTLFVDNKPVSTAFASFLLDGILEIGIQTVEGMFGLGYSAISCCKLIDYCIQNGLKPVWSCKKDNIGSVKLALKLGFEIARIGSYYKINL